MAFYLVTGGAGFIGSHLVAELLRRGERVRVLDNLSTGWQENLTAVGSDVDLVMGDIRDPDAIRRAVAGVDYVLHHAALVSVPQSMANPSATHDVNVTGTLNVLNAARESGVKRVVLASSCSVYGDSDALPLRETTPTRPLSPYAASKLAGEVYCQTFTAAYGLGTVALRYFNIYGARQNPNGDYAAVIPKFIARMTAGQAPIIFGDGQQTRDFVHVSDVVRANLLACQHPDAVGKVFNIASGRNVSLLDLVNELNTSLKTHYSPEFKPARPGDILHSSGDSGRIAALLGYRTSTSLSDGLVRTLSPEFA
ncbi:MAG: SDR family oxidoreductase [Chloroflexi bacterium]|nr:SDR family oxidoreductase [Chloroflexota bacterium]